MRSSHTIICKISIIDTFKLNKSKLKKLNLQINKIKLGIRIECRRKKNNNESSVSFLLFFLLLYPLEQKIGVNLNPKNDEFNHQNVKFSDRLTYTNLKMRIMGQPSD